MLGGAGAIIGGLSGKKESILEVSKIYLRITVNDTNHPFYNINLLCSKYTLTKDNKKYQEAMSNANHWQGIIEIIIKRVDEEDKKVNRIDSSSSKEKSAMDDLVKLSELFKDGFLTQEEFNNQKTKLLAQ